MKRISSDPLQTLLDHLREQTGITPLPLSAAERQSGMVEAFAAALAPPGQPGTVEGAHHRSASESICPHCRSVTGSHRHAAAPPPPGTDSTRQAVLQRIRTAMSEQAWTTDNRTIQPAAPAPVTPAPIPPTSPVQENAPLPPRRTAMQLAAYRKSGR
ncbi:MAG: hypothetical protein H7838_12400 [Magnetococcus sp. DMHC-8]